MNAVELLTRTLQEKQKKNPRFSLRAFAKQLNMSPSSLSLILNNKRTLTKKQIDKIMENIGAEYNEALKNSIEQSRLRTTSHFDAFVTTEQVEHIQNWLDFSILELFSVKPEWTFSKILKALEVDPEEAHLALKRLQDLEMIMITGDKYVALKRAISTKQVKFETPHKKELINNLHAKNIQLNQEARQEFSHQSGLIFALSRADFKKINKKIEALRQEIIEMASQSKRTPTDVYLMTIAANPVNKKMISE